MFYRCLGLLILLAGAAGAQSSNGYVFFAPGGVSCCGYTAMTLHLGVGGEAVLGKGVGIGAEIGALGTREDFVEAVSGTFSANGYYHFAHRKDVKVDPFVTGGYTLLFRSGHINLFNFGGGLNYWAGRRFGIRLEARDHVYAPEFGSALHYWGVRFGLAFR